MSKILFFILISVCSLSLFTITVSRLEAFHIIKVYAEDSEHEDEKENDHEDSNNEKEDDKYEDSQDQQIDQLVKEQTKDKVVSQTETKTQQVVTYIKVIDPGYNVDSDGDGLVDALDPDPKNSQLLYFTDTDGDSVPDIYDQYPGQDDFKVQDNFDSDNNGIIDQYEQ